MPTFGFFPVKKSFSFPPHHRPLLNSASEISAAAAVDRRVVDDAQQGKCSEPCQRRNEAHAVVAEIIAEGLGKTAAQNQFHHSAEEGDQSKSHPLQCVAVYEKHGQKYRTAPLSDQQSPYLRQQNFCLISRNKNPGKLAAENDSQQRNDLSENR